jgi:nitroreductase
MEMEPIHELLQERFSPRAFEDRSVSREAIRKLLEAARWAPSSFNEQPWRFFVATRDDSADFERLLECLAPGNQDWARNAPVLMLSVAKLTFSRNDKPNRHAYHDVGLAVSQLIVQATALGLRVHQMAGYDVDKARETYVIPEGFDPVAAMAIGYSGEEMPSSRSRRPQDETAFSGRWGEAY